MSLIEKNSFLETNKTPHPPFYRSVKFCIERNYQRALNVQNLIKCDKLESADTYLLGNE